MYLLRRCRFGSTSNYPRARLANTRRCLWSFALSSRVSWILYGCGPKSRREIRPVEVTERPGFCERRETDCFGFYFRVLLLVDVLNLRRMINHFCSIKRFREQSFGIIRVAKYLTTIKKNSDYRFRTFFEIKPWKNQNVLKYPTNLISFFIFDFPVIIVKILF